MLTSNIAKLQELFAEIRQVSAVSAPTLATDAPVSQSQPAVTATGSHSHSQSTHDTGLWHSHDSLVTAAAIATTNRDEVGVSLSSCLNDDVKTYLRDPPIGRHGCSLTWWKDNKKHLPCLAKVARSLLAIPATSVNSERLNSTSGNIVSVKRSSLLSEHVEELTFLNKNLL